MSTVNRPNTRTETTRLRSQQHISVTPPQGSKIHRRNNGNKCLICNSDYVSPSSTDLPQNDHGKWAKLTQVLCRLFDIDSLKLLSANNHQELFSSYNPFCTKCEEKIEQLNVLMTELESIENQIQRYHDEIRDVVIETFDETPAIGPQYSLKLQIFEKCVIERPGQEHERVTLTTASLKKKRNQSKSAKPDKKQKLKHFENSNCTIDSEFFANLVQINNDLDPSISISNNVNFPESVFNLNSKATHETHDCLDYFYDENNFDIGTNEEIVQATTDDDDWIEKTTNLDNPSLAKRSRPRKTGSVIVSNPHQRKIIKNGETQCSFCDKTFLKPMSLAKHITLHTGDRPYQCSICDRAFRDTSNRKRHEMTVHLVNSEPTICELCGAVFRSHHAYNGHHKRVHLGYKVPKRKKLASSCNICSKVFTTPRNLDTHVRIIHRRQFVTKYCSICGKPEMNTRDMQRHEQTHKSICELELDGMSFFYKCAVCNQGLPSKLKLKCHYDFQHPDVKCPDEKKIKTRPTKPLRYKCSECPNHPGYASRDSLILHRKNGHNCRNGKRKSLTKKTFPCETCSKPCKDRFQAKEHARTHDPARNPAFPYKCSECPPISGLFNKKDDLIKHFQTTHKILPIPEVTNKCARKYPLKFKCTVCVDHPGFTSRKGLNKHVKCKHTTTSSVKRIKSTGSAKVSKLNPKASHLASIEPAKKPVRKGTSQKFRSEDYVYETSDNASESESENSEGRECSIESDDDIKLFPSKDICF